MKTKIIAISFVRGGSARNKKILIAWTNEILL